MLKSVQEDLQVLLPLLDQALIQYNNAILLLKKENLPTQQKLQELARVLLNKHLLQEFSLVPLKIMAEESETINLQQLAKSAKQKFSLLQPELCKQISAAVPWLVPGQQQVKVTREWLLKAQQQLHRKQEDKDSDWSDVSSQGIDSQAMKQLEEQFQNQAVDHDLIDEVNQQLTQLQTQFLQKQEPEEEKERLNYRAKVNDKFLLTLQFGKEDSIVTGGGDDKVKFWQFKQGKLQLGREFNLGETIIELAYNYEGNILAAATCDELYLIRQDKLTKVQDVQQPLFISWHQKGNALLVGGKSQHFYIVNQAGKPFQTFFGHTGDVTCGLFSPDGKRVITCSTDASLRVWDPKTAETVKKVSGHGFHQLQVVSLALHSNNKLAATGSTQGTVCLSNWQTGKPLFKSDCAQNSVQLVKFYQKQEQLVAGSADGQLLLFDVAKGKQIRTVKFGSAITSLDLFQQRNAIAVGQFSGRLYTFDMREHVQGKDLKPFKCGSMVHRIRADAKGVWACCQSGQLVMLPW